MATSSVLTRRLLSAASESRDQVVRKFLLAFGVSNPARIELPLVFDSIYQSDWDAFCKSTKFAAGNQELEYLLTIADFVRYMQYRKVHPFKVKPQVALNPTHILKRLVRAELEEANSWLTEVIRKYRLLAWMRLRRSSASVSLSRKGAAFTTFWVFEPKITGDSLDGCLARLSGSLYSGKLPLALAPPTDKTLRSFKTSSLLLSDTGRSGWAALLSDASGRQVYIRRSSDGKLVLRVVFTASTPVLYGAPADRLRNLTLLWKKTVKVKT